MGGASIWHWIVVGLIVLLLFGRGKISDMMGDVAKGIKAFKKGMAEEDATPATPAPVAPVPGVEAPRAVEPRAIEARTIEHRAGEPAVVADRKMI